MSADKPLSVNARAGGACAAPRPLRIIVADDDRDTVLTLMMVLRDEGHEVLGAYNGEQVLWALRKFHADAVLLDIAMPKLSGWEIARSIKKRYGRHSPLLIAISGRYKKMTDKMLSQIVGFDHYLVKPYEPRDVLKLLAPLRISGRHA
jgi:DNA-binding response OmpR family regulator